MGLCIAVGLLLLIGFPTNAQVVTTVSSRWSDSFVEWEIFGFFPDTTVIDSIPLDDDDDEQEEEQIGELKLRWLNVKDDFSEWDFQLGDTGRGTIRLKWRNDPSQWELRTYDGQVVTMRTAWPDDFSEWRLTDNSRAITFRSRWTGQWDEWTTTPTHLGKYYLYTLRERDPRDWAVEDKLDDSVPASMKLAMTFLALFYGSPRM